RFVVLGESDKVLQNPRRNSLFFTSELNTPRTNVFVGARKRVLQHAFAGSTSGMQQPKPAKFFVRIVAGPLVGKAIEHFLCQVSTGRSAFLQNAPSLSRSPTRTLKASAINSSSDFFCKSTGAHFVFPYAILKIRPFVLS